MISICHPHMWDAGISPESWELECGGTNCVPRATRVIMKMIFPCPPQGNLPALEKYYGFIVCVCVWVCVCTVLTIFSFHCKFFSPPKILRNERLKSMWKHRSRVVPVTDASGKRRESLVKDSSQLSLVNNFSKLKPQIPFPFLPVWCSSLISAYVTLLTLWGSRSSFWRRRAETGRASAVGCSVATGAARIPGGSCLFISGSRIIRDNHETPTWSYINMRVLTVMNTGPFALPMACRLSQQVAWDRAVCPPATLLNSTNNVSEVQTLHRGETVTQRNSYILPLWMLSFY